MKAVDALTEWIVESLKMSGAALSEEVVRLESTAEQLAQNQQVRYSAGCAFRVMWFLACQRKAVCPTAHHGRKPCAHVV